MDSAESANPQRLLADLAAEYARSKRFLEQLESNFVKEGTPAPPSAFNSAPSGPDDPYDEPSAAQDSAILSQPPFEDAAPKSTRSKLHAKLRSLFSRRSSLREGSSMGRFDLSSLVDRTASESRPTTSGRSFAARTADGYSQPSSPASPPPVRRSSQVFYTLSAADIPQAPCAVRDAAAATASAAIAANISGAADDVIAQRTPTSNRRPSIIYLGGDAVDSVSSAWVPRVGNLGISALDTTQPTTATRRSSLVFAAADAAAASTSSNRGTRSHIDIPPATLERLPIARGPSVVQVVDTVLMPSTADGYSGGNGLVLATKQTSSVHFGGGDTFGGGSSAPQDTTNPYGLSSFITRPSRTNSFQSPRSGTALQPTSLRMRSAASARRASVESYCTVSPSEAALSSSQLPALATPPPPQEQTKHQSQPQPQSQPQSQPQPQPQPQSQPQPQPQPQSQPQPQPQSQPQSQPHPYPQPQPQPQPLPQSQPQPQPQSQPQLQLQPQPQPRPPQPQPLQEPRWHQWPRLPPQPQPQPQLQPQFLSQPHPKHQSQRQLQVQLQEQQGLQSPTPLQQQQQQQQTSPQQRNQAPPPPSQPVQHQPAIQQQQPLRSEHPRASLDVRYILFGAPPPDMLAPPSRRLGSLDLLRPFSATAAAARCNQSPTVTSTASAAALANVSSSALFAQAHLTGSTANAAAVAAVAGPDQIQPLPMTGALRLQVPNFHIGQAWASSATPSPSTSSGGPNSPTSPGDTNALPGRGRTRPATATGSSSGNCCGGSPVLRSALASSSKRAMKILDFSPLEVTAAAAAVWVAAAAATEKGDQASSATCMTAEGLSVPTRGNSALRVTFGSAEDITVAAARRPSPSRSSHQMIVVPGGGGGGGGGHARTQAAPSAPNGCTVAFSQSLPRPTSPVKPIASPSTQPPRPPTQPYSNPPPPALAQCRLRSFGALSVVDGALNCDGGNVSGCC